jgi:hypothetical protein
MQSEQLTNLHPGLGRRRLAGRRGGHRGPLLGGVGLGLVGPDAGATLWVSVSLAGGFFVGGLLVGMRWSDAPLLHGAAITFVSVLVWFAVLLLGGPGGPDSVPLVLGLILLQPSRRAAGVGWAGGGRSARRFRVAPRIARPSCGRRGSPCAPDLPLVACAIS